MMCQSFWKFSRTDFKIIIIMEFHIDFRQREKKKYVPICVCVHLGGLQGRTKFVCVCVFEGYRVEQN